MPYNDSPIADVYKVADVEGTNLVHVNVSNIQLGGKTLRTTQSCPI